MRRLVRAILLAAAVAGTPIAVPAAFAFEVQTGGVALSAQGVAMLANRMAAKTADRTGPGASARPVAGAAREERLMEFMLDGRTKGEARTGDRAGGLDDLKAALHGRR